MTVARLFNRCSFIEEVSYMNVHFEPITLKDQGSFFVGGRTIAAEGTFDPTKLADTEAGQSFPVEHAFVRYQIPADAHRLPVVMVHGQGQFSKTWESTPDGREGFATLFLRRGHPVYLIDFPGRGGAGLPSFKGPAGSLLGSVVAPNKTMRFGNEEVFVYFRLGPAYGEYFPDTAFPKSGLHQFLQQNTAHFVDDYEVVTRSICALLDRLGPSILLTHSQSGHFGWRSAIRSDNVRIIASYEPGPILGCYFPSGRAPEPMLLYDGTPTSFATEIDEDSFRRLTRIPILVVHGDYIPNRPVPNRYLDIWRVRDAFVRQFCATLNGYGGTAKFLSLPELGIRGNTHFPFSDLNTLDVANVTYDFLREQGH